VPCDAGWMLITDLAEHPGRIAALAAWHFDYWGPLTGADTLDGYRALLTSAAQSRTVPSVLIAVDGDQLLGSANLVVCDLPVRPTLTPWLAQLFVEPTQQRHGIGAALVRAVLGRAAECGHDRAYLFTSGTLPEYYARLGWRTLERVRYLGAERTVMDYALRRSSGARDSSESPRDVF
jgi:GNAT superfamily N-acetyltransferase